MKNTLNICYSTYSGFAWLSIDCVPLFALWNAAGKLLQTFTLGHMLCDIIIIVEWMNIVIVFVFITCRCQTISIFSIQRRKRKKKKNKKNEPHVTAKCFILSIYSRSSSFGGLGFWRKKKQTNYRSKMLTVVLAHCWSVVTIEPIGSRRACECLTALMVASTSYLNRCYCCRWHGGRIRRHRFHLDVRRMVMVVDLWLYPASLCIQRKTKQYLYERKNYTNFS